MSDGLPAAVSERTASCSRTPLSVSLAVLVGSMGVLMAHHPMLLSGMRRMQTDPGDTRFNNYMIEHAYRWLVGTPGHGDFWSPLIFFPVRNTAAYSDVFLSVAPIYGVGRLLNLPPDTSFQVWMIATSGLNYLIALHLLHRRFQMSLPAACAGAFLFAFGAPRINQMGHQQLLPQFLGLVTVDALLGIFPGHELTAWRRGALWMATSLGLVAQFYAGFYLGWFLLFAIGLGVIVALGWPSSRGVLLATLRRDVLALGAAVFVGCLLLVPLVTHYLAVSREVGFRQYWDVSPFIIDWTALLYIGPESWLWGWAAQLGYFVHNAQGEKRLGVGLLTTLASVMGLYWNRDSCRVRLIMAVAVLLFVCVTSVPRGLVLGVSLGASLLALSLLFHLRRDYPTLQWLAPAVVLVFLNINPFTSQLESFGIGLFTLIIGLTASYQARGPLRARLIAATATLLLGVFLFDPRVLAIGALMGGLVACAAGVLGLRPHRRIGLVAIVVMLAFASLTTFGNRPLVLVVGGSAPLCLLLTRSQRLRLPAPAIFRTLIIALSGLLAYRNGEAAWFALAPVIPGASALRAVSRVGMLLLIPWSIGLGLFVQAMLARHRPLVAVLVVLVCMLEQGMTTLSYDKDEHRSAVAALAREINPRLAAFYYSPHEVRKPLYAYHLDAMWAGLERGVPTINGYSGNFPSDWYWLYFCNVQEECDLPCLEFTLQKWANGRGLSLESVDWIGGPPEWQRDRARRRDEAGLKESRSSRRPADRVSTERVGVARGWREAGAE